MAGDTGSLSPSALSLRPKNFHTFLKPVENAGQQLAITGIRFLSGRRNAAPAGSTQRHDPMNQPLAEVLTLEELSLYLRIPRSTLYKIVREGKVPGQKVGRHWRFRKETIDRWLDRTRQDDAQIGEGR